jgi:hypothetical protein
MREQFQRPPREHGILPFWFLNGELDEGEMRWQLRELREKGMAGVILHGRYGLETPYIGETYLERIALAVDEAASLGLQTWVYDEMNWPSGTADQRVLRARPDLAQRYLQCIELRVRGPWFAYLTGEDSRYLDFERSTPVAAFAISSEGEIIDLTPNLSFEKVLPWQVPPGDWRLMHIVEKRADYYIDALDPESTAEFLRIGYEPYARSVDGHLAGFYTDEPAMHYYLSAQDIPIVPWTKDMFRRFRERNGYELRPKLPHLFADLGPEAAQIRFDFYETTTALYSEAYYAQIHDWCRRRGVAFTGHLLYEEWLRAMVRAEGNPFRHYEHLDVVGVDHLYPVIGDRERPAEHVAIKLAASAAHQHGSERLLCESFGGLFMDTTMQRMKWIADWEYVLGVNLLNPHGFHYTLEGPRKRDWPPSMFYQYPWWRHYGGFSDYIARLSYMLTGGRHVAKVAVLWPMTSMFANYVPHVRDEASARTEGDFSALTDALLRAHHDFDYLDEEVLARADLADGVVRIRDEAHEVVVVPPMTHLKLATVEALERFGGHVLSVGFLPTVAFGPDGMVDVADRMRALCGDPLAVEDVPATVGALIESDIVIDSEELFCLHRVKDGRDVFFVVNPTFEPQAADVHVAGDVVLWDPSTGAERPFGGRLELPPVGSVFLVSGESADEVPRSFGDAVALDGEWTFEAPDGNALVIREFEDGLVPGAWEFQQPTEPHAPYPFAVKYRARFEAEHVPERLDLLIDGFAGSDWSVAVNDEPVIAEPRRSRVDSQMRAVEIPVRPGRNEIVVRLTLTKPTDGLLDPIKLIGDFAVRDGVIVAPPAAVAPSDWTRQGHPFYSGCGVYRTRVNVGFERAVLDADAGDDVLEVVVNGESAGIRLWPPYALDVALQPGENELELRVCNTPANLLEGTPRRSGLTGPPRLIPWSPSR